MDKPNSSPVVIFIHGWPVTPYHWRFIGPVIESAGYQVKYITPRGLGRVDQTGRPYDKLTLAHEIRDQLDREKITDFAVVGHDWGGTIGYLLAKDVGPRCWALVIEEEILPGIAVNIPAAGSKYYPQWHGPFNRSAGLGEALIPGNERAYYSQFLKESSGKNAISQDSMEQYLTTYSNPTQLNSTLGYYRTAQADQAAIKEQSKAPIEIPVLAIGGLWAMGGAVGEGMASVGNRITSLVLHDSGHYPAEQEPTKFACHLCAFLQESL